MLYLVLASAALAISPPVVAAPAQDVPPVWRQAWTDCRNEHLQLSAEVEMAGCDKLIAAPDTEVDSEAKAIAHANRGMLLMRASFFETARNEFDRAIRLNLKLGPAYYNRALLSAAEGKTDEAIVDYGRAVAVWPQIVEAYVNRGIAYAETGKTDLALADFTKAIEMEPNNPENYENRAALYHQVGRDAEADADMAKAKAMISPAR